MGIIIESWRGNDRVPDSPDCAGLVRDVCYDSNGFILAHVEVSWALC